MGGQGQGAGAEGAEARMTVSNRQRASFAITTQAPSIPSPSVTTTDSAYSTTSAKNTSRCFACNYHPICHNTPSGGRTIPPPARPEIPYPRATFQKKIAGSYSFISPLSHKANRINSALPSFCTEDCAKQTKIALTIYSLFRRESSPRNAIRLRAEASPIPSSANTKKPVRSGTNIRYGQAFCNAYAS